MKEQAADPMVIASDQVCDAMADLKLRPEQYLHFPWPALDRIVEGLAPGDVWYVCAFSGHGKTTFISSAIDHWFNLGKRIYWLGLESRPKTLRTHWACKRLGIDAGEVLSGRAKRLLGWEQMREAIVKELLWQVDQVRSRQIYISPEPFINTARLEAAAEEAVELRSDVLVIDHIDHIELDGSGSYGESVAVNKAVLKIAQNYGIRMLVASQLNNETVRGNRLAMYQPPQPQHVYMGGHKRQIASGMLGLYRPLNFDGPSKEDLAAVRDGGDPSRILEPNAMNVVVMKHRLLNLEGKRCSLRVERGNISDFPERDAVRTRDTDGMRVNP